MFSFILLFSLSHVYHVNPVCSHPTAIAVHAALSCCYVMRTCTVYLDLLNVVSGVYFNYATCAECEDRHYSRGVYGIRWKCAVCRDYVLCLVCYMSNKHYDLSHEFIRLDTDKSKGYELTYVSSGRYLAITPKILASRRKRTPLAQFSYDHNDGILHIPTRTGLD